MPPDAPAPEARAYPAAGEEVVSFLAGRSVPCPRCGYDLRDAATARCPECGEPLVLRVGSPKARFGWIIAAMAPGCFSGVAAMFVAVPIVGNLIYNFPRLRGVPWPMVTADAFGFLSAGCVIALYRHRQRIMGWPGRRQAVFAAAVWGVHVAVFLTLLMGMVIWY